MKYEVKTTSQFKKDLKVAVKRNCDIEEFCNAKIFDGKSFWEIEPEVEWVDC